MRRVLIILYFLIFSCYSIAQSNCNKLNFDGIDDYGELNSLATPLAGSTNNFTIEFWMKGDKNNQPSSIRTSLFSINPATSNGNGLLIILGGTNTQEGKIMIYDEGTFGTNADFKSTQVVGDMVCHHIAYVRNGNNGYIYIDGLQVGSHTTTYSILPTDLISIGQEWDNLTTTPTTSQFFNGDIEDLRVWTTSRSQTQIQTNMNNELIGNEPGLLAYYKFNQGFPSGNNTGVNSIIDQTINTNHGNLIGFNMNGTFSNFIQNDCILCNINSCKISANFSFLNLCVNDTTSFQDLSIDSIGSIINWKWYFGDGDSLVGLQNPNHFYSTPGTYNVSLVVVNDSNCIDSITIPLTINSISVINKTDSICQGGNIFIGGSYQNSTGTYTDSLQSVSGCDSIVYTQLTVVPKPTVKAYSDTTIEKGDYVQIQAIGASFYSWTPNSGLTCSNCSNPVASPNITTQYVVEGNNGSCSSFDTVLIIVEIPEITLYIPNSFTPDGDGINDEFLFFATGFKEFEAQIFNRWGELLFETMDIKKGWDAIYKGKEVPLGVYVYKVTLITYEGRHIKKTGAINVLK